MRSTASHVENYLESLPEGRRLALETVRKVVRRRLPRGYIEVMNWGMISYEVPLSTEPHTYNGKPLMYAALASQKNHMAIYLCGLYCVPGEQEKFVEAWKQAGRKLDMGKSCIRFKRLDDLDLDVIGDCIAAMPVAAFVKASKRG